MKYGWYFIPACCIGDLGTDAQILNARACMSKKDVDYSFLAQYISSKYGTPLLNDKSLKQGYEHYWVVDSSDKRIFNAADFGYAES